MISKRLLLKIAMLIFGCATLHAVATPAQPQLCRDVAVLCSTNTSWGECGYEYGADCYTCYGDDGSVLANSPDCSI